MRFLVFFYCLFQLIPTQAAEINLGISQTSKDEQVIITVENRSPQPVTIKQLELILNKKTYVSKQMVAVLSGQNKHYSFTINWPEIAGSYAQQVNLYYLNDEKGFTLTDIGLFNYKKPFNPASSDKLYSLGAQSSLLILESENPEKWQIVLPGEVTSTALQSSSEKISRFRISGNYSGFNNNYPVFAVSEGVNDNRHYAQILKTTLQVRHGQINVQRGWTPNAVLAVIVLLSLSSFVFALSQFSTNARFTRLVLAYGSRLFWLSSCYYLLKNAPLFLSGSTVYLEHFASVPLFEYVINFFNILNNHLTGKNYTYFFQYFIDVYLWGFVVLYPVYLYFFAPRQIDNDKYVNCLQWTLRPVLLLLSRLQLSFNAISTTGSGEMYSNEQQQLELQAPVKKGFLILAVKLFFLPLLASWVIGNIIHQWNLVQSFEWTFHQINAFILALLILTDTSIFLAGYSFESYRAKNQIRSVEPTILGWVVCLWCYPPFNQFSFDMFDYQLFSVHINIDDWVKPVVLSSITLLWGIFVWASFTLGLKASNLTNRGTVSHGPYRYCRHPAYTAKIMIWAIEAVFLGKFFIGLLLGFALIYFLRAWTEERHMALDKEYRDYQQLVPYRFIPGVI